MVNKGKQCGARRKYGFYRIFEAPILPKLRNQSRLEIECQKIGQFFDTEWLGSDCDTLKQPVRKFPVRFVDLLQGALVCLVKRVWQFGQGTMYTSWMAAAKIDKLAIYPTKPNGSEQESSTSLDLVAHIPSARFVRVSITSCLSSRFHLRLCALVLTTDLM